MLPAEAATASGAALVADPLQPAPFRVLGHRRDTDDTVTLRLAALDGAPLPFAAGQFTMLGLLGIGEVPISISGDPARPQILQHTVRDVGGVTHALVHAVEGDLLEVRGPYGRGWSVLDATGDDVVLVAGGIGLAPLRPALLDVLAHRDRFGRVVLLYGCRSPGDVLYAEELTAWQDAGVEVQVTVDYGPPGWAGRVGLVTTLVPKAGFDPARTTAFVCGPEVMMRYAAAALVHRGVPACRVRLSLERTMKCGVGLCGHCQLREVFVCVDGPVLAWDRVEPILRVPEV